MPLAAIDQRLNAQRIVFGQDATAEMAEFLSQFRQPARHDMSWAGRLRQSSAELQLIAEACLGDPVTLTLEGDLWLLLDQHRRTIGRKSRNFVPPASKELAKGEIGTIVRWKKSVNDESFQFQIKRDDWETVLPELQFSAKAK